MSSIRGSIEIARPPEIVFDTVADQTNEIRYNAGMTDSVKLTDGPLGVGTTFQSTMGRGRTALPMITEYTAYERPRRLASRSTMSGAVAEGEVRCDPIPGGTRFSWDWQISVSGAGRFAGPLIGFIGRRRERQIWAGLKRMLEEDAP